MARNFNGITANWLSHATLLGGGGPFSLFAWVNPNSFAATAAIMGHSAIAAIEFRTETTGKLGLLKGSIAGIGSSTGALTTGSWFPVGVSYDQTNWAFYISGAVSGTGTSATSVNTLTTIARGFDNGNGADMGNFVGADCAVWNVILTATEMAALGKGIRPNRVRPLSLIGYWPLDGSQSPEPDLSGAANNSTVNGSCPQTFGPPYGQFTPRWPIEVFAAPAPTAIFRRTLSKLGTRTGSRQAHMS